MKYSDYEKAFSPARLKKYLTACDGNIVAALALYRHNIRLCQKFYGLLNIFEVVLRNTINEHFIAHFSDPNWIRNQLVPGGMLETHPQKATVDKIIADLDKAGKYNNDRIVSSVTFGFWTYLFTKEPFRRGGKTLLRVFPYKTPGVGQRVIFNELQAIKAFRNRIAHYEAVCFDATGRINTQSSKDIYALVKKYIQFLGYTESQLYYGLDVLLNKTLQRIDNL